MSEETKLKAHDFLAGGRYVQIATVTQDNKPSLRNIAYVLEGNKIYFLTDKTTSKFKEIKNNPNVACLISKDEDNWSKTLQLKVTGKANLETNENIAKKVLELLGEKYPGFKDFPPDPNFVVMHIKLESGALMDNTNGFFISEGFNF